MKFTIDTGAKTITLKEGTTVEELNGIVKEFNLEGYKIVPEVKMDWYPFYPTWPACPTYVVQDAAPLIYQDYSHTSAVPASLLDN